MEDIKLRAFDRGEMIYHDVTKPSMVGKITELRWLFDRISDEAILMRFTSQRDKDDKEIYEGDYLEDEKGNIFEVSWNANPTQWWAIAVKLVDEIDNEDYVMLAIETEPLGNGYLKRRDLKIIGNKYETKLVGINSDLN
jgi:hypothetical protein